MEYGVQAYTQAKLLYLYKKEIFQNEKETLLLRGRKSVAIYIAGWPRICNLPASASRERAGIIGMYHHTQLLPTVLQRRFKTIYSDFVF